jgi:AcrR family transcriptional regulator
MTTVDRHPDIDTVTEAGVSRPLRKDALRNRQALIAAAREVFAERGLDASLDDVAHRAGLGVGTAYRHFANKHELAKAIFAEAIDNIIALADEVLANEKPWDGLVRFIEGVALAQTADRGLREVMMGVHDPADTDRIHDLLGTPIDRMVTGAKASGDLRPDAESSDIGVVIMMLCTVADVTGDRAPDLWRRYLPMLLAGLRPGAPLPVPPLSDAVFREAMSTFKERSMMCSPAQR